MTCLTCGNVPSGVPGESAGRYVLSEKPEKWLLPSHVEKAPHGAVVCYIVNGQAFRAEANLCGVCVHLFQVDSKFHEVARDMIVAKALAKGAA
jgi:hypothetical protein